MATRGKAAKVAPRTLMFCNQRIKYPTHDTNGAAIELDAMCAHHNDEHINGECRQCVLMGYKPQAHKFTETFVPYPDGAKAKKGKR